MRQNFNVIILITGLLFSYGILNAQDQSGSPYTRYGLGDILSDDFGDSKAMGGTGIALRKGDKLFVMNPASYTSIDSLHFVLETGVNVSFKRLNSNAAVNPHNINNINLDYISFGFPVTQWCGASAGILPFSNVGYNLITEKQNFGYSSEHYHRGEGGISKAFVGASFNPVDNLSLGINVNYLFGNISQLNSVEFDDDGMVDIKRENTTYFKDFYYSVGAQYSYDLSEDSRLTAGVIWDFGTEINAERNDVTTNALSSSSYSTIDTVYNRNTDGTVSLPQSLGFGLSYDYKDILTVSADFHLQDWSDAKFFGETDSLGTSQSISLGAEYIPAGRISPSLNYFEKVRYRIGGYYNNSYLQFNNGETTVNDFGISFGLGLPLGRSKTTINLSLELGQRGSMKDDLVREQYAVLGVNFSLTDIWFIKRKFK